MIYMAPFYRMHLSGRPMTDIVRELKTLYQMNGGEGFDSRIFFRFQTAQKRLAYRIIHYESNRELLIGIPHRRLLDFALVYYLSLEGKEGARGSALVYNDYLKAWGVSEEELYRKAEANTPVLLPAYMESLDHVLEGMILPCGSRQGIFVISNEYNFYGAAAVFYPGVLRELSEALDSDLYLLPSSVHEFLALSVNCGIDEGYLQSLVESVNQTQVAPEEVLSSGIYRYSRGEDRISACGQGTNIQEGVCCGRGICPQ